ncbi:aromatic ring-opening dioxygenase LigA [Cellulomonas sp. RIT-PI-Y]|uniref:aromatic ring-opening dioxygenase LigA n=1 Tax=Cellulomonas sp. RIT-PI-Y TaxID=3035297 RepID=UPI0021DA63E5|nr:aromatic ring-opening dioxygenase LigA [Cellulomonas sp. RIT-PI-Y]
MTTVATTAPSKAGRVIAIISAVAGLVLLIAGGVTWGAVSSHLADENITVSGDAANFAGDPVTTPWAAFAQADIIAHHALEATDGKTYAELEQDDPLREVAMNASFLRASLFTSVVAFGVAALVMGLGVLFLLVGWALWALAGKRRVAIVDGGARTAATTTPVQPTTTTTTEPGAPNAPPAV